jgi:hypothetical protein
MTNPYLVNQMLANRGFSARLEWRPDKKNYALYDTSVTPPRFVGKLPGPNLNKWTTEELVIRLMPILRTK